MPYNSTILVKKRKLACGCYDFAFSKNMCRQHATIASTQKRMEKETNRIIEQEDRPKAKAMGGGAELQRWFQERRKEMTGRCAHCGGKSSRDSDQYHKHSIAHLLPKAYFKSVATHPDNWIELCFFGESCHTNFDHQMLDITDLNCFDLVIQKFVRIYPSIATEERRRIPKVLLDYIEVEK